MNQTVALGAVLSAVMAVTALTLFAFGSLLSGPDGYDFSQELSGTGSVDGQDGIMFVGEYSYRNEGGPDHIYYLSVDAYGFTFSMHLGAGIMFGRDDLPTPEYAKVADGIYSSKTREYEFTFHLDPYRPCHVTSVGIASLEGAEHSVGVTMISRSLSSDLPMYPSPGERRPEVQGGPSKVSAEGAGCG